MTSTTRFKQVPTRWIHLSSSTSQRQKLFYQSLQHIHTTLANANHFRYCQNHSKCNCNCHSQSITSNHISRRHFFDWNKKTGEKDNNHMHSYLLRDGNKQLEYSALRAIEDYEQALNMQETSEGYTKRGFAYFYIKDYKQAMKDINKAIELNPRSIEAYCAAASIQVALNKHENALDYLNTALELTSPVDFRRNSIEEVVRGCKLQLRTSHIMSQQQQQQEHQQTNEIDETSQQNESNTIESTQTQESQSTADLSPAQKIAQTAQLGREATVDRHIVDNVDEYVAQNVEEIERIKVDGEVIDGSVEGNFNNSSSVNDDKKEELMKDSASKMVDVPFDDPSFMDLQKDITQQMVDIGGEEFQKKLMKLNDIPAVQKFQQKALKGEKPSYDDYMELMKDERFKRYNAVMTEIAKNPKFTNITAKFAEMDWMGAYEELKKDPEALALYMKAFDCLE